jgi:hypothetical protein
MRIWLQFLDFPERLARSTFQHVLQADLAVTSEFKNVLKVQIQSCKSELKHNGVKYFLSANRCCDSPLINLFPSSFVRFPRNSVLVCSISLSSHLCWSTAFNINTGVSPIASRTGLTVGILQDWRCLWAGAAARKIGSPTSQLNATLKSYRGSLLSKVLYQFAKIRYVVWIWYKRNLSSPREVFLQASQNSKT